MTARIVRGLAALVLFLGALVALGACHRGQFMREQCPESGRTYCPAQHGDTTRVHR